MKVIDRSKDSKDDAEKIKFKEFIKKHEDELMLHYLSVIQLIGFAEDEDEYYYIIKDKYGERWLSYVNPLYPLKGVIPDYQYNKLNRVFTLNEQMWNERMGK